MEKDEHVKPNEADEIKPPEADTPPEGAPAEDGDGGKPPEEKKEVPVDIRNLRKKAETAEKFLKEQGYEIDPATGSVRKVETPEAAPTDDKVDIDAVVERKLNERSLASQKEETDKVIKSEIERLSAGDEKLMETIRTKFDSFKGDRDLTPQQAREMVYDAAVVIGEGKGRKVSSFMNAGSGGGGSRPSVSQDERSSQLNEKVEWLRNTAGYRFQNKDQADLMNKLRR